MSTKTKASSKKNQKATPKKVAKKAVAKKAIVKKVVANKKVSKPISKAKPVKKVVVNKTKSAPKKSVKAVSKAKPVVKASKPVKKASIKKVLAPVKKVAAKKITTKKIIKVTPKAVAKTSIKKQVLVKPAKAVAVKPIKKVISPAEKKVKAEKPLKVKKEKAPIVKKPIVAPTTFRKEDNTPTKFVKEPAGKFEMEFVIRASEDMVYEFISTESGLSEWFCDDVNIRNNIFTFTWDGQEQQAKLVKEIPPVFIRYQWLDKNDGSYFEFRIQKDELTNDISLIITDFAIDKADEVSARLLWHSQIDKLLHVLGSFF